MKFYLFLALSFALNVQTVKADETVETDISIQKLKGRTLHLANALEGDVEYGIEALIYKEGELVGRRIRKALNKTVVQWIDETETSSAEDFLAHIGEEAVYCEVQINDKKLKGSDEIISIDNGNVAQPLAFYIKGASAQKLETPDGEMIGGYKFAFDSKPELANELVAGIGYYFPAVADTKSITFDNLNECFGDAFTLTAEAPRKKRSIRSLGKTVEVTLSAPTTSEAPAVVDEANVKKEVPAETVVPGAKVVGESKAATEVDATEDKKKE